MLNADALPQSGDTFTSMNRILLFGFFFLLSAFAYSQEVPVSLKLVNQKGEPVTFATVAIIPVADTTAQQNKLSDSAGGVRGRP